MFELDNYPRNPLLILVFTAMGMLIRYCFYSVINILMKRETKKLLEYSDGISQVIYNLLLTFIIVIALFFYLVFDNFKL